MLTFINLFVLQKAFLALQQEVGVDIF